MLPWPGPALATASERQLHHELQSPDSGRLRKGQLVYQLELSGGPRWEAGPGVSSWVGWGLVV